MCHLRGGFCFEIAGGSLDELDGLFPGGFAFGEADVGEAGDGLAERLLPAASDL